MDPFLFEAKKLLATLLVPKIIEFLSMEGIEYHDVNKMTNYLCDSSVSPNYTIVLKCTFISNKGKPCTKKAVNGKNYCATHAEREKKQATKKTTKKSVVPSYVKKEDANVFLENEIIFQKFDHSNDKLLIHENGYVIYQADKDEYFVIGKYPETCLNDDLLPLLEKINKIIPLSQRDVEIVQEIMKIPYHQSYIETAKTEIENLLQKSNEIPPEKKKGRKPKTENVNPISKPIEKKPSLKITKTTPATINTMVIPSID